MRSVLLTALLMMGTPAIADTLTVDTPWVREAPPGMQMMAGYAILKNSGDKAVQVVNVESEAFADIEMHTTKTVDGVAKMIQQETLVIPAGGELTLAPGGYHLMLMQPKERYTEGKALDMTLTLDNGDSLTTTFTVKKGDTMMGHHHHHH